MPLPNRLSLDDLAAIACAPPDAGPAELARELGKPRYLVDQALLRIRRAGGWYLRLKLVPWRACGLPVAGPGRRLLHESCGPSWQGACAPRVPHGRDRGSGRKCGATPPRRRDRHAPGRRSRDQP